MGDYWYLLVFFIALFGLWRSNKCSRKGIVFCRNMQTKTPLFFGYFMHKNRDAVLGTSGLYMEMYNAFVLMSL